MMNEPISPPAQSVFVQHIDESKLPKGQCRYILLNPEVKGQRCGCVCFTLNHDHPGVTCNCGHQSCYHITNQDALLDAHEVEKLRQRVKTLEDQLDRENQRGLGRDLSLILKRLGDLEEVVEKSRDEFTSDIKGCHRNITRTWEAVDQVAKRQTLQNTIMDERLDDHDDNLTRLDQRFRELNEESISLDERVESLEGLEDMHETLERPSADSKSLVAEDLSRTKKSDWETHIAPSQTIEFSESALPSMGSQGWTVHVSLLPCTSTTKPFPKDSRNYKRCLSRGLHRMVAIKSHSGEDFSLAVTQAFGDILDGQKWMLLQRDDPTISRLPTLKPLDVVSAEPGHYTYEFLKEHCGVLTADGKVDSLYIVPRHTDLSWDRLREGPVYLAGLEDSWKSSFTKQEIITNDDHAVSWPKTSKKRASADISAGEEFEQVLSTNISTADTIKLSELNSDTGDDMNNAGRATKSQRTNFDLPVSLKLRTRRETAAPA